jgi:hypothetical protein
MSHKYMEECLSHFNEIGILNDSDIVRLVGYAEDEDDVYYVVAYPSFVCDSPKIVYSSMVGSWETLKGIYSRYDRLERQFVYWNCPPQENPVVELFDER